MNLFLILVCFLGAETDLEQNVRLFWDALSVRDKATALHFVHPEDLNHFLNQTEVQFERWKIVQVELQSEVEASVSIVLDRSFPNGVVRQVKGKETWQKTDQGWRVRIESFGDLYQRVFKKVYGAGGKQTPTPMPDNLDVHPKLLKLYALTPKQPGVILIRNGRESEVEVVDIEIDPEKFEVIERADKIEQRSVGKIVIRYLGTEKEPNLTSLALLRLKQEDQIREFRIPITYNYVDALSIWVTQQRTGRKPNQP